MRIRSNLITLLAFAATIQACNAPLPVRPTVQATAAPTALAAPSATLSPEPAPTELGSPTGEPAAATAEPRGLRVAYVLDGNLWGLERGAAPVRLTDSGTAIDLRMSDDGERIAYLEFVPEANLTSLRSVRFDGTDDRVLVSQAAFDALYPLEAFLHYVPSEMTMVPGTHALLLNTRGLLEGPGLAKNNDLIRVDTDTGQVTALLPRGAGGDFVISPDGSQLAIVRPESIGFVNADGSQLRPEVLRFPLISTYSEYLYYPSPVWVGDSVIAAIPAEDPFFGPQQGTLWQVPAADGEPVRLATLDGDLFGPQFGRPIVSPDGAFTAFYRRPEGAGTIQLWIHEASSGSQTQYAEGTIEWLGWAPDARRFAFRQAGGLDLRMGQVGGAAVPLGSGQDLRWIDERQYVLQLRSGTGWRLVLASLDGSAFDLVELSGDLAAYRLSN